MSTAVGQGHASTASGRTHTTRPREACLSGRKVKSTQTKCHSFSGKDTDTDPCLRCRRLGIDCQYSRKRSLRSTEEEPRSAPSQRLSSHPSISVSVSYPETTCISLSPIEFGGGPDSTSFSNLDPPTLNNPQPSYSLSTCHSTSHPVPLLLDVDGVTSNNLSPSITFLQTHDSPGHHASPREATSASSALNTSMSHDLSAHLDPTLEVMDPTLEDHRYDRDTEGDGTAVAGSAARSGMVWKSFLLSDIETAELVKLFHTHLNPMIVLLDPNLHTLPYLRSTCPILLDVILSTTARFFRPNLANQLSEHSLIVVNRATIDGVTSIELIQALCILVYWKAPTDRSAWIKLGLALRIAYQLRMHETM